MTKISVFQKCNFRPVCLILPLIKRISPIAWRHVNLLGRFEFQLLQNPIDIDEMIKSLEQEIVWQKQKPTDEQLV
jgi:hypothetical protein